LDLLPDEKERDKRIKAFVKKFGWKGKFFTISAMTGDGCKDLTYAIMDHISELARPEPTAKLPEGASE
jgi:GTP-binding protein